MLDQTLVSILLGLLAVAGTLGGALGGTLLANRHAMKLEELKIKQEKVKKDTQVIEEVYSLLIKIHDLDMDNINNQRFLTNGTKDDKNRVWTLVSLYLPSVEYKLRQGSN